MMTQTARAQTAMIHPVIPCTPQAHRAVVGSSFDSDDSSSDSMHATGSSSSSSDDSDDSSTDSDDSSNDSDDSMKTTESGESSNDDDDDMIHVTDEAMSDEKMADNVGQQAAGGLKASEEEEKVVIESIVIVSGVLIFVSVAVCLYLYKKDHTKHYDGVQNEEADVETAVAQDGNASEMTAINVDQDGRAEL
eukprot:699897_1